MDNSETKTCQNCNNEFTIEPEDFAFYEKISVPSFAKGSGVAMPPPTFCPECRMVRRMNWRNERTLYKRVCDAPEHNEEIISIYHKDSPLKVYDNKYWWSDEWDPMAYDRDYDFSKPFFEQFEELMRDVPIYNLSGENNINSEYVNFQTNSKNCYLVTGGFSNENLLYSNHCSLSKDSSDIYFLSKSELCFENVICSNSYHLFYSYNSNSCRDSYFLYDCKNCSDCFGCVGLRNRKYCIFNKQYTKKEYFEKLKEFNLGNYKTISEIKEKFKVFKFLFPHKFLNSNKVDNVSGDNIINAKNCKNVFDVMEGEGSEDSKFLFWSGVRMKDIYDGTGAGVKSELCYEVVSVALDNAKIYFSVIGRGSYNILYSIDSHNSSNLFGCVGLRNKEYCILNKQYTKEEYEKLVPKIIEHMNNMPYTDKKGRVYRYGEFFPPELSPFAYNETIAQEYFPLTKEQAIEQGYQWKEQEERNYQFSILNFQLPDPIKDVNDDIVNKVIQCAHYDIDKKQTVCNEQCATAFKIIPRELEFYKKQNIPIPRLCPNCRHYQRIKQRNPLKLWHRKCQCAGATSDNKVYENTIEHPHHKQEHCPVEFETSYAPERKEIVYCEKCYRGEVV